MKSTKTISYRILKDGKQVGSHKEYVHGKSHLDNLFSYQPFEDYQIQAHGIHIKGTPWERKPECLAKFLSERMNIDPTPEQRREVSLFCLAAMGNEKMSLDETKKGLEKIMKKQKRSMKEPFVEAFFDFFGTCEKVQSDFE